MSLLCYRLGSASQFPVDLLEQRLGFGPMIQPLCNDLLGQLFGGFNLMVVMRCLRTSPQIFLFDVRRDHSYLVSGRVSQFGRSIWCVFHLLIATSSGGPLPLNCESIGLLEVFLCNFGRRLAFCKVAYDFNGYFGVLLVVPVDLLCLLVVLQRFIVFLGALGLRALLHPIAFLLLQAFNLLNSLLRFSPERLVGDEALVPGESFGKAPRAGGQELLSLIPSSLIHF